MEQQEHLPKKSWITVGQAWTLEQSVATKKEQANKTSRRKGAGVFFLGQFRLRPILLRPSSTRANLFFGAPRVGPEGWRPRAVGARRVGPKFRVFFVKKNFALQISLYFFLLSLGSSRGVVVRWFPPWTTEL